MSALSRLLRSVEAVRNTRAVALPLGTFASAGLLAAMVEASLARNAGGWGPLQAGAALFVAYYGGNAAGILVMDDACGRAVRDIPAALRASLSTAHRLLLALAIVFGACATAAGALLGLLWLSRAAVTGAVVGPLLFAIATFVVMTGGRVVAQLAIAVVGVDVPAPQPMAGLFGHGLRSLGAAGAPMGSGGHAAAALVGGGVVFALALALPGLVYLRGTCAVCLAMTEASTDEAPP